VAVATLPGNSKLFNVPTGLLRILDADIAAAGIVKTDDRGPDGLPARLAAHLWHHAQPGRRQSANGSGGNAARID
jgi:hypothetical protein